MGKTIGILSLKGGVGKTSSVIALGDAMANFGRKVLLVDGNFSAPNIGMHLNVLDSPVTLHHVLSRNAHIKDAIYKAGKFDVIPSSLSNKNPINVLDLRNQIKLLKKRYDIILIDSSPALNDETLAVMLASDEILVITTPDIPSISTTMKAVKAARQRGTPISGIIINKTHNKDFELSIEDIEYASEVPVLAIIPYDISVQKSLSQFIPSTSHNPTSKSSEEYKKLAGILIGEKYNPFSLRNLFGMTPKREEINREIFYRRVLG